MTDPASTPTPPPSTPPGQRLLVGLLIAASMCVTLLVIVAVFRQWKQSDAPVRDVAGQSQPVVIGQAGAEQAAPGSGDQDAEHLRGQVEAAPGSQPPVLFALAPFSLPERSGNNLALSDLAGKVWIADFIFTRCAGPCPRLTAVMAQWQKELALDPQWPRIRLVSFSVDPGHDTPPVLAAYAKLFAADEQHWLFLTGRREAMWQLVRDNFRLGVGPDEGNPASPILHSTKLVLVDGQGRIRGYYDGFDDEAQEQLRGDLQRVLAEEVAPATAPAATAPAPAATQPAGPLP